ncbi:MAG: 2-succinyl-5-enolpyruvyl-6-hydroxy-3-cyclohexene-1-carboxylic-acid synthase [bacterium]
MFSDAPNINALWSNLVVEELARLDIDYFCVSPGSRSTPLTLAVANHPKAKSIICLDERGAAFHALGYARATGKPAALICTSGTAVANYYLAIVEASVDCVPMLILSADRPPELRETGANQTIRQQHIFGDYVRWFFDMPCPDTEIPAEMVLTTIDQAVYRATRSPAGPVHLNFMFREPLGPVPSGENFGDYLASIQNWQKKSEPLTQYFFPSMAVPDEALAKTSEMLSDRQGLLIVGQLRSVDEREAVQRLVQKLSWIVFADITSGLRLGSTIGTSIDAYDFLLRSEKIFSQFQPEVVLQVGSRITSKRLRQFLKKLQPSSYVLIANHPYRHDPGHHVSMRLEADIPAACDVLAFMLSKNTGMTYFTELKNADLKARKILHDSFFNETKNSEPAVAYLVSNYVPPETGLFLASSMPVRDMGMFASVEGHAVPVAANRGASGIDGTIASAAGFSAGLQKPATLLIGDLAFLHDLNSLAQLQSLDKPLVIVLLNNNGGGIFSFLPVAAFPAHFEKYFGTPHGYTFKSAADLFGLAYNNPQTMTEFIKSYQGAFKQKKSTIIEVMTDREENLALHRSLEELILNNL